MSEEKDDLKSFKVYKFNNTKGSWHDFTLKFRVIADYREYDDIIEGKVTPPDEKENLEILEKDNAETKKSMKEKSWQELQTRKVSETWYCQLKVSRSTLLRIQLQASCRKETSRKHGGDRRDVGTPRAERTRSNSTLRS